MCAIVSALLMWSVGLAVMVAAPPPSAAAAEPKERTKLKGHKNFESLAFSPDGKTLASAGAGGVKLWDPKSGKETLSLEADGKTRAGGAVAFSPDGKVLATNAVGNGVKLFDPATGRELKALADSQGAKALAFSPDGNSLATTAGTWDLGTGLRRHTAGDQFCVAYSPDGKSIALGGNSLALYDAATGEKIRKLGDEGHALWAVAFRPDGKAVASLGLTSKVRLWDPATGMELSELEGAERFESHGLPARPSLAISADGKLLAVGEEGEGVWLWDLTSRKKIATLKRASGPVAFSRDGRTLATGGEDEAILLWDLPTDK
jgi:WD40 repeat protein